MFKSGIKLAAIAIPLISASVASASISELDGKGFNIIFNSGVTAYSSSQAPLLSLSSDKTSVIFNVSALDTRDSDAQSDLSFSIVADKGYSFSGLSLFASGSYTLTRDKENEDYAGLTSSVAINGSSARPLESSSEIDKKLTTKRADNGNWSLSNDYKLSSTSFATASKLDFSSTLLLSSFVNSRGLATIKATDYTLQVATAPVPEPEQWAMMLVGIGMVGTIIGRRSRG